ncbi:hypothetical protein SJAG_06471 [Schizosaccharomyces japonicus yFS275]|uniref:Uncharacterized protein n=1 Tax=Schizosaccharomyces japonicus (strain yFS275 / FY16936) TaxID=402676 RepID=T0S0X2_SCHJY|nr:hypothetical protein SJAG_06471 [Schizosaccharomyces japonicus yFS275]EQC52967.1 hypothetical protein SJAG_06471 [Schizosaccharomyces japonicus yFS275]
MAEGRQNTTDPGVRSAKDEGKRFLHDMHKGAKFVEGEIKHPHLHSSNHNAGIGSESKAKSGPRPEYQKS